MIFLDLVLQQKESKVLDTLNELYTVIYDYTFHFLQTRKEENGLMMQLVDLFFQRIIKV